MQHESVSYKVFKRFNFLFMIFVTIVMVYPYLNVLAISLNEAVDSGMGGITFFPRKPTLENFITILSSHNILQAGFISVSRVICGTLLALLVQFSAAYGLEKKDLPGRNKILVFFLIPMFISGGLIPYYLLLSKTHILNTFWVYILPSAFSFYNTVIIRTYMRTLPEGLFESARLDGATEVGVLFRIVIPLSLPIVATIALFCAVGYWNDWTTTLYFCSLKQRLYTLQFILMQFLKKSENISESIMRARAKGLSVDISKIIDPASLRAAQIIITTLPIVLVYPFLQKYFIKGVLIGSIKE